MKIAMFEGYGFGAHRRRRRKSRRGGRRGSQSRLARAARACKGKPGAKFRACVRKKMKSRR
jgi:hypothetical protein